MPGTRTPRISFAVLRLVVAAAIVAAIAGQLVVSLAYWHEAGIRDVRINIVSFFSFFTIDSNIASVFVLAFGGYLLLGRRAEPSWFLGLRAAVVTYMVVTGIVYNVLLRGIELPQGFTLPWSNEVLHVVAPVYLLVDWLFAPGRRPLGWRAIGPILVFPIVWAGYTLLRGPFTPDTVLGRDHWYPYPFLDPNISPRGYLSVAFSVVLIATVIGAVAAATIRSSRLAGRPSTRTP